MTARGFFNMSLCSFCAAPVNEAKKKLQKLRRKPEHSNGADHGQEKFAGVKSEKPKQAQKSQTRELSSPRSLLLVAPPHKKKKNNHACAKKGKNSP